MFVRMSGCEPQPKWWLQALIRLTEVMMKPMLTLLMFIFLLGVNTLYAENKLTGGAILLEDIRTNRAGMVEVYRKNFTEAFSKMDSDFSDDFKALLAECSAELMVQQFEVMTVEEINIYHDNPEIAQAQSERIFSKCYDWIVTELENAKNEQTTK